jgi:hypothetical protein
MRGSTINIITSSLAEKYKTLWIITNRPPTRNLLGWDSVAWTDRRMAHPYKPSLHLYPWYPPSPVGFARHRPRETVALESAMAQNGGALILVAIALVAIALVAVATPGASRRRYHKLQQQRQ